MKLFAFLCGVALVSGMQNTPLHAKTADGSRKIVLIAGSKSHGPGQHEYVKSARLLKVLLDRSPNLKGVKTEVVYDGWPTDPSTLDTADTIVFITDGMKWLPWTFTPERVATLKREMDRGCGLMEFHFATYIPDQYAKLALAWSGGYIKYDGDNPDRYSVYKTITTDVILPSPKHDVLRGVHPFHIKEEFYYKATFVPGQKNVTPLLRAPNLPLDPKVETGPLAAPKDQIAVWAFKREHGARSISATFGHYDASWTNDDYRKMILNAVVWTARIKVPHDGVQSTYANDAEVESILGPTPAPVSSPLEPSKP